MIISPASAPLVPGTAEQPLPEDLEGACRALEKVFAQMMFQKMREAMVPASSSGADGFARSSAEGMLDSQWAELASQGDGLGLWRSLYRQLSPDEVKSAPAAPDQWTRGNPLRRDADIAAQGGVAGSGPRSGRPRPVASAALAAASYRQAESRFGAAAGTDGKDHNP